MKAHNDNDTWQPLSLATRRLLVKLNEKQDEQNGEERSPTSADEEKRRNEARYIEQRMRDIERFERMVSGYYRPSRERN
jgi:tetrahydromethanopterin S-methyltransferase subunit A